MMTHSGKFPIDKSHISCKTYTERHQNGWSTFFLPSFGMMLDLKKVKPLRKSWTIYWLYTLSFLSQTVFLPTLNFICLWDRLAFGILNKPFLFVWKGHETRIRVNCIIQRHNECSILLCNDIWNEKEVRFYWVFVHRNKSCHIIMYTCDK